MNVTLLMAVMSGNVQSLLQWSPDNPQLLLALHSVCVCSFSTAQYPPFPTRVSRVSIYC